MADISHLLIPVPPENEQNKIQNKINALYTMIETLLELTKSAQQTQLHGRRPHRRRHKLTRPETNKAAK